MREKKQIKVRGELGGVERTEVDQWEEKNERKMRVGGNRDTEGGEREDRW